MESFRSHCLGYEKRKKNVTLIFSYINCFLGASAQSLEEEKKFHHCCFELINFIFIMTYHFGLQQAYFFSGPLRFLTNE